MKKIMTILLMLTGLSMQAMEDQESGWNLLPNEIKAHILHYVGQRNTNLADFFKCALVSPEFACFVLNHPLTQVKKYKPVDKKEKIELKDLLVGAIQSGDARAVKALIDFKTELASARTEDQDTMLILATKARQKEIVELLLLGGAYVKAQANNCTALDVAQGAGFSRIADLLISYGATAASTKEYRKLDTVNETKLMCCLRMGMATKVGFIGDINSPQPVQKASLEDLFIAASSQGIIRAVKLAIGNGVNVNVLTKEGETGLMLATKAGHKQIVELLLTRGALFGIQRPDGKTALDIAYDDCFEDIADLLMSYGATAQANGEHKSDQKTSDTCSLQ